MQKIILIAAIICITFPFGIEVNAAPQSFLSIYRGGGGVRSQFAAAAAKGCLSDTSRCKQEFKEIGKKIKKFFQDWYDRNRARADPVTGMSPMVLAGI